MKKFSDCTLCASPDYEAMYAKELDHNNELRARIEELGAELRAVECDLTKYKTVIKTMEFILGRELRV